MNYNIYLQVSSGAFNLLDVPEIQMRKVLTAYLRGESEVTLSGKTYQLNQVYTFKIFENQDGQNKEKLEKRGMAYGHEGGYFGDRFFSAEQLLEFGKEVTNEIVGDDAFGSQREKIIVDNENFISITRIEAVKALAGKCQYDLSKLIALCKEINDNYVRRNYYSVALLLRTLLNHVPPAFSGKESFDQVLAELNGPKHKTKKEILSRLHELQRKFADLVTHERLREFEPEITLQQVSFLPEIDYLLQEVTIELEQSSK